MLQKNQTGVLWLKVSMLATFLQAASHDLASKQPKFERKALETSEKPEADPIFEHDRAHTKLDEKKTTLSAPTLPISLSEQGLSANIQAENTSLEWKKSHYLAKANVGLGYGSYTQTNPLNQTQSTHRLGGNYQMSVALGEQFALGATYAALANAQDMSLIGIYALKNLPVEMKWATQYLWGKQNFGFASGNDDVNLTQRGNFMSARYHLSDDDQRAWPWLHAIGLAVWQAQAHRSQDPSGDYYYGIQDLESQNYVIYKDLRALSLGKLYGAATEFQAAASDHAVIDLSLGFEESSFPFLDGSLEKNKSFYHAIKVQYEPTAALLLGGEYKRASSESRVSLQADIRSFSFAVYQNWGLNGVTGNKGVTLSYQFSPFDPTQQVPLAQRLRRPVNRSMAYLLDQAILRPSQLPMSFLAKIDNTANIVNARIDSEILNGTNVRIDGDEIVITLPNTHYSVDPQGSFEGPYGSHAFYVPGNLQNDTLRISIPGLTRLTSYPGAYRFSLNVRDEAQHAHNILISTQAQPESA